MRWPLQQVANALSARTPRSSLPPTRARDAAGGGLALERIGMRALVQRTLAVGRLAEAVDHPAEPGGGGIKNGRVIGEIGARAKGHPVQAAERHDERPAIAEADHFAGNMLAGTGG